MKITNLFLATLLVVSFAWSVNAQEAKSSLKRGDAFVAQANYEAAIEEYSKVPDQDPDSYARAIYNIGVCHYELWQTEEAIVFYKRAIELKRGNYPRAAYALGVALQDQGKFPEAKRAFEQAPNVAPAIYKLGVLEAKAGELKKAARLFRDAASREGQHVPASRNNLGVMLARLGFLREAEKEFAIALKSSNGAFADAAHNLKLCRSLMHSAAKVTKNTKEEFLFVHHVPFVD